MDPRTATRTTPRKLTYNDYVCFPVDGQRHELIDGEHYVTPTPRLSHQRLVGRLHVELSNYFEHTPLGECFVAPLAVILSDHDVVEPDVLVVLNDRRQILQEYVHGAPTVAIEVVSPGTRRRDERVKRDLYERAGVLEYWIVYPERGVVRVARRNGHAQFEDAIERSAAVCDSLTSPLLPTFKLPLTRLFRASSAR